MGFLHSNRVLIRGHSNIWTWGHFLVTPALYEWEKVLCVKLNLGEASLFLTLQQLGHHIPLGHANPWHSTAASSPSGTWSRPGLLSAPSAGLVPQPGVWGQLPTALPWQRGSRQAPLQDPDHERPGRVAAWQHHSHPCGRPTEGVVLDSYWGSHNV